jgi:hypothetical protein
MNLIAAGAFLVFWLFWMGVYFFDGFQLIHLALGMINGLYAIFYLDHAKREACQ